MKFMAKVSQKVQYLIIGTVGFLDIYKSIIVGNFSEVSYFLRPRLAVAVE